MNAGVNIVYPIKGKSFPVIDPAVTKLKSAYITASFSTTCDGGGHKVEWGFDNTSLGSGQFYDQMSVQLVWKLPEGKHTFWVKTGRCGKEEVPFIVG
ncbi:MAG: hypothetical protein JXB88_26585 [Spirochaetales bacterium]|nr:hypothetical protein [Spirochaetales bacterium]